MGKYYTPSFFPLWVSINGCQLLFNAWKCFLIPPLLPTGYSLFYFVSNIWRIFQIFFSASDFQLTFQNPVFHDLDPSKFGRFISWPRIWSVLANILCGLLRTLPNAHEWWGVPFWLLRIGNAPTCCERHLDFLFSSLGGSFPTFSSFLTCT